MSTFSPVASPGHLKTRRRLSGRQAYVILVLLLGLATFGTAVAAWNRFQPRQTFLVAAQRLPQNTMITPADLMSVQVDPTVVPAGAFQQAEDAVGQTVAETLEKGDYVTQAHLSNAPGRVATGLHADQRLINIPTNGAGSLVDGLQPGDRFDLLLSFPASGAGVSLSGALIEGLVLRSFSDNGSFQVIVPLLVAVFIAQTEGSGKLSIFASPALAQTEGVPALLTGQVCQVFLAPDGSLVPAESLPAGVTPCPGIYALPPSSSTPTL